MHSLSQKVYRLLQTCATKVVNEAISGPSRDRKRAIFSGTATRTHINLVRLTIYSSAYYDKPIMPASKSERMEFLQGTLEMLILRTLMFGPKHGYGIAQFIRQTSSDVLLAEAGSLYPALQRLEMQKLITAKWEMSENNRRVRHYRLTAAGRAKLSSSMSRWDEFVQAIGRVLHPAKE